MVGALLIVLLLCQFIAACSRYYCPPANFVNNSRRIIPGLKTAIITEIHGNLWARTYSWPLFWAEYFHGDLLSRSLYNHAGVLGIDKIIIGVFYNASTYPKGPTVEEIYPAAQFCVVDWYKLGVIDWRPVPYGGPVNTWPLDKDGKPTQDRDYYKTLRVYNPFYAEIRNQYDWVFVMDPDEQLTPVNFNVSTPRWCHSIQPSLISRILQQMLTVATKQKLRTYSVTMNSTRDKVALTASDTCAMGFSFHEVEKRCKAISSIYLPTYLWTRRGNAAEYIVPTIRSIYPGCYSDRLKSEPKDGQEEWWKSVYQTKHSPLLEGRSLHENPVKNAFTILAPRSFHGVLSLEMVHQRTRSYWTDQSLKQMMSDRKLVALSESYWRCMKTLSY